MARLTAIVALSIAIIGCSGCAREWSKPGTTEQEFNADRLSCEQEAAKLYPIEHPPAVYYRPASAARLDTNCVQQSGFNNCDAAGNAGAPSADPQTAASDYNRTAAVKACLTSKGYTYRKARP